MPNYHAVPKISSLAAHVTPTRAVFSRDLLEALLDGREFIIGGQRIKSASDKRDILRRHRWAARAVEVRS
jgi:hypothetical protein